MTMLNLEFRNMNGGMLTMARRSSVGFRENSSEIDIGTPANITMQFIDQLSTRVVFWLKKVAPSILV